MLLNCLNSLLVIASGNNVKSFDLTDIIRLWSHSTLEMIEVLLLLPLHTCIHTSMYAYTNTNSCTLQNDANLGYHMRDSPAHAAHKDIAIHQTYEVMNTHIIHTGQMQVYYIAEIYFLKVPLKLSVYAPAFLHCCPMVTVVVTFSRVRRVQRPGWTKLFMKALVYLHITWVNTTVTYCLHTYSLYGLK